jgi:hypothetical protein
MTAWVYIVKKVSINLLCNLICFSYALTSVMPITNLIYIFESNIVSVEI